MTNGSKVLLTARDLAWELSGSALPRLRVAVRCPHLRHPRAYTSYITDFTHVTDSNSEASPVDTNNQPAKNSEGRVIEWITQYLRDGDSSLNGQSWKAQSTRLSLAKTAITAPRLSSCVLHRQHTVCSSNGIIRIHHGPRCGRLRLVRAVLAGDPDPPVWRPRSRHTFYSLRPS